MVHKTKVIHVGWWGSNLIALLLLWDRLWKILLFLQKIAPQRKKKFIDELVMKFKGLSNLLTIFSVSFLAGIKCVTLTLANPSNQYVWIICQLIITASWSMKSRNKHYKPTCSYNLFTLYLHYIIDSPSSSYDNCTIKLTFWSNIRPTGNMLVSGCGRSCLKSWAR